MKFSVSRNQRTQYSKELNIYSHTQTANISRLMRVKSENFASLKSTCFSMVGNQVLGNMKSFFLNIIIFTGFSGTRFQYIPLYVGLSLTVILPHSQELDVVSTTGYIIPNDSTSQPDHHHPSTCHLVSRCLSSASRPSLSVIRLMYKQSHKDHGLSDSLTGHVQNREV